MLACGSGTALRWLGGPVVPPQGHSGQGARNALPPMCPVDPSRDLTALTGMTALTGGVPSIEPSKCFDIDHEYCERY